MVTLPSHTSHVLQPLNITYFKPFNKCIQKGTKFYYDKQNYLEPNKIILVGWVEKVFKQSLKKEIIKSRIKACEIQPLNPTTMVGKFGLNELFTITQEEDHESDFSNATIKPMIMGITSRNQPKCNQSIYDYMRLVVICDQI